jgi:hypothetical protein
VGFALLQAARKQVAVDRLQQSRQPGWAVQAYHLLKLLPGTHAEADADPSMYVIFNYWMSKQVGRLGSSLYVLAQAHVRQLLIGLV